MTTRLVAVAEGNNLVQDKGRGKLLIEQWEIEAAEWKQIQSSCRQLWKQKKKEAEDTDYRAEEERK